MPPRKDKSDIRAGRFDWAIITPSYNLDFERCRILCRSIDAFVTGSWHHYIIVDPPDVDLFRQLQDKNRTIICKNDVLPQRLHYIGKVPFMRLGRFWWSSKHGPIFGWQMQQFIKISMASFIREQAMLFCDSDLFFIKPVPIADFVQNGKLPLNSSVAVLPEPMRDAHNRGSAQILRLPVNDPIYFRGNGVPVVWHTKTTIDMVEHIAAIHSKPWHEAIGSRLMFSEFQLYRMFVRHVQGHMNNHYVADGIICKTLWTKDMAKYADVATFCRTVEKNHLAVCIQSSVGWQLGLIDDELSRAIQLRGPKKATFAACEQ